MIASPVATKLIKDHEGYSAKSYLCPAGEWTIGYGETGPHIGPGMLISQGDAEAWLNSVVAKLGVEITSLLRVTVSQNQFDALVSFTYNIGIGALKSSSLLKFLNQGDYNKAAQEFLKWTHANGKVLPGLVDRRQAEYSLFNSLSSQVQ